MFTIFTILNVKFYVKDILLQNAAMYVIDTWPDIRYWSKVL